MMTWIELDLFGEEEQQKTNTKKTVKLASNKNQRDRLVQKQVINIKGQIVTVP